MIEAILNGLHMVVTAKVAILMLVATLIGNFFGLLPALGGVVMLALLIPFVYGWAPFEGLAFLLAAHAVVNTGGAIPSILFGIPGQGACVATIIDGHPMAKQGKAGEAMGAQLCASGMGGVLGAVVLAVCIPILKPILMAFGPAETFMLVVFGLTFIIVIGRENLLRGFISACLGLLLGTIGSNPFTGENRFAFGQLWLFDGINIVVIAVGLFGFTELIDLGAKGGKAMISETPAHMRWGAMWNGSKEVFREWWLTLRTSLIGAFIGLIPGIGGETASWVCYGHAVQTCKNNENFGKGDIRGVIGVEAANNSKEGGALLPTLVFGIPGSAGMAILLGAFLILGISPGPTMIVEHLDMVWGMVWVLIIGNVLGALSLYPICAYMGNIAFLRASLLIAPIAVLAATGAYSVKGAWTDLVLTFLFMFVGFGMRKFKFNPVPLLLAFILGPLAENYLVKTLTIFGVSFLKRPIVLVLLTLMVISLVYTFRTTSKQKKRGEKKVEDIRGRVLSSLFFILLFAVCIYLSQSLSPKARFYPLLVGITGIFFSVWLMIVEILKGRSKDEISTTVERRDQKTSSRGEAIILLWMVGFLFLVLVFGFWVAIAAFTPLFMYFYGHENRKTVAIHTVCLWLAVYLIFEYSFKTDLFGGIFGLTW
ncbi:MAG: tripartite tricarboxylate transporter permease [Thermodesulfobacteriota bacterium]